MNERINKLYDQAWLKVDPSNPKESFTKAFAELIVKECVWQVVKDDKVPQDIQVLIGERFKQHFGVE